MGRPANLWSIRVGARGASVRVYERTAGGSIWLRWWVPSTPAAPGHDEYRDLGHADRTLAERQAKEIAAQLLAPTLAAARQSASLSDVLARYQVDVADHTKGAGPREAKRRSVLWTTFLGADCDVSTIDEPTLDRFARERRAGLITLPASSDFTVRTKVSDRAVGADIEYLRAALYHATKIRLRNGKPLLAANPIAGYKIPQNKDPRRVVATYDRFLKVMEHADAVDGQQLFGGFMGLVEALGWRVSAICALRWSDVDLSSAAAPQGRIFKRADADKEGRSMWVPLSKSARAAVDRIRAVNPGVGEWPLFPAPRAREEIPQGEIPKPWSRHHARKLLERAEDAAELGHMKGSDFHAYRRKWATERKHLPDVDVAAAGAWGDTRALKRSYQQVDDDTLLAVMNEPTKLRDPAAVKKAAEGA